MLIVRDNVKLPSLKSKIDFPKSLKHKSPAVRNYGIPDSANLTSPLYN